MKVTTLLITWIFGLTCGLSIASWLVAKERIGDAIVFLYTTNGLAVLSFIALVYLVTRHLWARKDN